MTTSYSRLRVARGVVLDDVDLCGPFGPSAPSPNRIQ